MCKIAEGLGKMSAGLGQMGKMATTYAITGGKAWDPDNASILYQQEQLKRQAASDAFEREKWETQKGLIDAQARYYGTKGLGDSDDVTYDYIPTVDTDGNTTWQAVPKKVSSGQTPAAVPVVGLTGARASSVKPGEREQPGLIKQGLQKLSDLISNTPRNPASLGAAPLPLQATAAPNISPALRPPRLPGETFQQYKKRTGL